MVTSTSPLHARSQRILLDWLWFPRSLFTRYTNFRFQLWDLSGLPLNSHFLFWDLIIIFVSATWNFYVLTKAYFPYSVFSLIFDAQICKPKTPFVFVNFYQTKPNNTQYSHSLTLMSPTSGDLFYNTHPLVSTLDARFASEFNLFEGLKLFWWPFITTLFLFLCLWMTAVVDLHQNTRPQYSVVFGTQQNRHSMPLIWW